MFSDDFSFMQFLPLHSAQIETLSTFIRIQPEISSREKRLRGFLKEAFLAPIDLYAILLKGFPLSFEKFHPLQFKMAIDDGGEVLWAATRVRRRNSRQGNQGRPSTINDAAAKKFVTVLSRRAKGAGTSVRRDGEGQQPSP
jgi:hypothetical protein